MRFFGSKLRESHSRKRDGQQHHPLVASSGEGVEGRTDVANKRDHGQQRQQSVAKAIDLSPTSRGLTPDSDSNQNQLRLQQQQQQQHLTSSQFNSNDMHSSNSTAVSSSRDKKESRPSFNSIGIGRCTGGLSPRSLRAMMTNNSNSSQGSNARPMMTTIPMTVKTTATAQELRLASSPNQASGNIIGGGTRAKAPPSILHRNKRLAPTTAAAAAHDNGNGHQQTFIPPPAASFDITPLPVSHNPRVRFMSAGSVASNSEASQVHLMAGAAGSVASSSAMSSADNNRDNVFDRVLHMVMAEEHERLSAMGMSRADPKSNVVKQSSAKKTTKTIDSPPVMSVETRGAVVLEGGVVSRGPIDIDTGSHIIDKKIDVDTSMEVEYHDRNDYNVPEERWTRLNDTALASGMQDLAFDSISPQGSDSSSSHSRRQRGTKNKTTKKLGDIDLKREEWVAFDNKINNDGSNRNSDNTRRVNGLASF